MAKWKSDSRTQKYRRPRNQQYFFDQDSRPSSPLQVSRRPTYHLQRYHDSSVNCINDACETSTPSQIRTLFGIILTTCSPSAPAELWEKYKSKMSEDILHPKQLETSDMTFDFTSEIYNYTLVIIEDLCVRMEKKTSSGFGNAFT